MSPGVCWTGYHKPGWADSEGETFKARAIKIALLMIYTAVLFFTRRCSDQLPIKNAMQLSKEYHQQDKILRGVT